MEKIKITLDIFNKIQETYSEYDSGEMSDRDAVCEIIYYVERHNIPLFNEFTKIEDEWCEYPSNDSLLSIMDFVEKNTEIPGYHYETKNYELIVVKN